jgi:hypothetical protein
MFRSKDSLSYREYNSRLRKRVGIGFAFITLSSAGLGYLIADEEIDNNIDKIERSIEAKNEEIKTVNLGSEEAEKNIIRVKQQLGEACASKLVVFMPGGELQGTEEDSIVDDLVNEPETPCGTTQIEVRKNVRKLSTQYGDKDSVMSTTSDRNAEIAELNAQIETEENNRLGNVGLSTGLSLFFVGVVSGIIAGFVYEERRR